MEQILKGKKGLIMGVLNNRSIAWGIAKAAKKAGAELAMSYGSDASKKRLEPLAQELGCDITLPCNVLNDQEINDLFDELEKKWGKLDFLVHSIAHSNKDELQGEYVNTSRDNFKYTMEVSAYSLVAVAKRAQKLMKKAGGGSIITMTYYGSTKVLPNYNVMGVAKAALEASVRYLASDLGKYNIRVNAISSGPVKTLAAAGISGFNYMSKWNEYNSPLRRNVTIEDNGKTGVYLLSDMSSGVTGEVLFVDSGYHVVGMKNLDAPDMSPPKKEEN